MKGLLKNAFGIFIFSVVLGPLILLIAIYSFGKEEGKGNKVPIEDWTALIVGSGLWIVWFYFAYKNGLFN